MTGLPIPTRFDDIPHIDDMPSFTIDASTNRFTRVNGGYVTIRNKCYVNILLKLVFDWTSSLADWDLERYIGGWRSGVRNLPVPKGDCATLSSFIYGPRTDFSSQNAPISFGGAFVIRNGGLPGAPPEIYLSSLKNLNGTTDDIYILIRGSYDIE